MLNKTLSTEIVTVTPEMAMNLLECNTLNRPLSDSHVKRIANQIIDGKWRFNGDTIKISDDGQVLDGQHRLWAVVEAKRPIGTIIVRGVQRDAFTTIDTICRHRSSGDTIALSGQLRHRNIIGGALSWLIRWQRGVDPKNNKLTVLENYRALHNRIENSDIEAAFAANGRIVNAVQRAMKLRRICNPSILGFLYFAASNRNLTIAEQFMLKLEDPADVGINHPFYQFRAWLTTNPLKRKEPEHVIALAFKALNAAAANRTIALLKWTSQGNNAERYPQLDITPQKEAEPESKPGRKGAHEVVAPFQARR